MSITERRRTEIKWNLCIKYSVETREEWEEAVEIQKEAENK